MAVPAGSGEPLLDGVADSNGNIVVLADQFAEPVEPGKHVHLRLVSTPASLFGLLPDLPELSWEDFEEASEAAISAAEASVERT